MKTRLYATPAVKGLILCQFNMVTYTFIADTSKVGEMSVLTAR